MAEPSAATREVPSLILGKYRLEREVGRGGMGVVYLATHVALEQRVAIKIVLPALADTPNTVQRVLREARCAAQITGDHVVRVMDVGQLDSGEPFIVMEYAEGEDLARVLERSERVPLLVAVHWLIEACVAIAEAHARGIIHRDLKPANLFLARAEDGRELIKVLDFGISKQLGASQTGPVTRAGDVMGSPNYMAPEQIRTPLLVDARADLWALGAILLELLTGRRAFPGDTITAVYTRVLEGEPELPDPAEAGLPAELMALVRRCLAKDPNDRIQTVHGLVEALAPFSPARSQAALRAIARRADASALGRAPFADTQLDLTAGSRQAIASPARDEPQRLRRLLAAGVVLGLAIATGVAVFVAPEPVFAALGEMMSGHQVPARSVTQLTSALEAPSFGAGPLPAGAEADASPTREPSLVEPASGPAPAPQRAEPVVRVCTGDSTDVASRTDRALQTPPAAGEGEPRTGPRAERDAAGPGPSRVRDARDAAAGAPPALPVPNPWDVSTFGGRS
ncbi:MAG TPA: serine/threonine-protein kinase [Polyangiaceae bacterium]|nr:serine/threonine-protein kinase [Polyangiaceae bacterium]